MADYGYNRLKDLFEAIPHVVQVVISSVYHLAVHLFKILLSDNTYPIEIVFEMRTFCLLAH